MKSIFKNSFTAFLGLMIFSNAFAQPFIELPKQEIPAEYEFTAKIGDSIPNFTMTLTNGKIVSSKDWRGKVVMLQFTTSWSGVCRKVIPLIEQEIWTKNKHDRNFVLYGVDRDEPLEKVKRYQKEMEITYPIAIDPFADVFGIFADKKAGVTRNVILDKQGKIVFMTRLYKESEFKEMVRVISLLLK